MEVLSPRSGPTVPRLLLVTRYRSCFAVPHSAGLVSWPDLLRELSLRLPVREKKDGAAFALMQFRQGESFGRNDVLGLSAVLLDMDNGPTIGALGGSISEFAWVAYSTYSHVEAYPRYRLIFPLSRDVTVPEWPTIWSAVNRLVGGCAHDFCDSPTSRYYLPHYRKAVARQKQAFFKANEGNWLDPDSILRVEGRAALSQYEALPVEKSTNTDKDKSCQTLC